MPSRQDSVHLSEAESTSCFDVPSQAFSGTTWKRDHPRHDLNKTKIKLHSLEQNADSFEIQKSVFIKKIKSFQSEQRALRPERDSLKKIVEQQSYGPSSNRKHCKGSYTVEVSTRYLRVATEVLAKLS